MHSLSITQKLKKYSLSLFAALFISLIFINPIPAHAATNPEVEVEAIYSDDTYTPSANRKWYATYGTGTGYKGQGILIYLLDRRTGAAVPGTMPVAFGCSDAMRTYELHAQDKFNKYPEVTQWHAENISWHNAAGNDQNGGFIKSSITYNTGAIKEWLQKPMGRATKGIALVETLWGQDNDELMQKFVHEEYILIAEPIVAIQFAQKANASIRATINTSMSLDEIATALTTWRTEILSNFSSTSISEDLNTLIDNTVTLAQDAITYNYPSAMVQNAIELTVNDINTLVGNTQVYLPYGDVYAGTAKKVIEYYDSLSSPTIMGNQWRKTEAGRAYFRRSANACAVITQATQICRQAIPQSNLWPVGSATNKIHNNSDITTKSLGMLAMLARSGDPDPQAQTTANESLLPEPHRAPNESTGSCKIIKTYRDRNLTTGTITYHQTFTRENVCPNILIEDESTYKVKAWRISSFDNPDINGLNWESAIPAATITSSGTTTPSLVSLNDTTPYLYVLLEDDDDDLTDANYALSQSIISRHITINTPDNTTINSTELPNLSTYTFTWTIPAHTTTCSGTHTCSSEDTCNNDKYHTTCSSGCTKCPDTCTENHNGMGHTEDCSRRCRTDHNGLGHTTSHSDTCPYGTWYCGTHSCSSFAWQDQSLTYSLKNDNTSTYPYLTSTITTNNPVTDTTDSTTHWSSTYTRTTTDATSLQKTGLDYHTLIHRGKTDIVLARWKNSDSVINDLQSLSSTSYKVSNTLPDPSTRLTNREISDYIDSFTIKLVDNSSDPSTKYGANTAATGGGKCENTQYLTLTTTSILEVTPKVSISVYSGGNSSPYVDTRVTPPFKNQ